MAQVIGNILNGDTVLFIEKANSALVVGTRKVEKRSVEAPENEATVLGSQESFTDDIKINCSLILKRLPVPNLRFEEFTVGTLSCTKMKLIWLEGIANPEFINEARRRIRKIDIDNVDGIGVIGELIEDKPSSLFPKYRQTERPDVAARNLTDGHFLIICSNSPFAFIAPTLLWDNFRSMDDYEERSLTSSYLRIIRYVAFALSILISSLYLSFVTYNQAIVPPNLALNIAAGREGVPLPSVLELLFLTFFITIIREAGLRMPGSVGFFVATLAAVVIGQAVVTAGYVSPSLIIIVAIGTISSFAISTTTLVYPARLLNYIFIILAGCFGIFGVINGLVFLFWYLATLSSFGVPYLYPLIPLDKDGIKDLFVRSRLSVLKKRMKILSPQNRVRKGDKGIK
jgi:spore germination protein KA